MEKDKKIASALITVAKDHRDIHTLNDILGEFSSEIIARQGLSLPSKNINIISLILESEINTINNFAGKIGKMKGINIKILINKS